MKIYEFTTSLLISAGSTSVISLPVIGGLMQQFLVRANTSTTTFRANLVDDNQIVRRNYGFAQGEIDETGAFFPMVNRYTIFITNASQTDTFRLMMAVQE